MSAVSPLIEHGRASPLGLPVLPLRVGSSRAIVRPEEFRRRCQKAGVPRQYHQALQDSSWMDATDTINDESLEDAVMDPELGSRYD